MTRMTIVIVGWLLIAAPALQAAEVALKWDANPETNPESSTYEDWSLHFVDSANPGYPGTNAIDGDSDTFWHTEWAPVADPQPHTIDIDLGKTRWIESANITPRQDLENGRIDAYQVYASMDGIDWGTAVASGNWDNNSLEKVIEFEMAQARYFRLRSTASYGPNTNITSLAEIKRVNGISYLAGYKVYYKTGQPGEPYDGTALNQGSSGFDMPLDSFADPENPEVALSGLIVGETYYFVVTAYNDVGRESGYSNEVAYLATDGPGVIVIKRKTRRIAN